VQYIACCNFTLLTSYVLKQAVAEEGLGCPDPASLLKHLITSANFPDIGEAEAADESDWQFGSMAALQDEDFQYLDDDGDDAAVSTAAAQR
jgi:hypothetical protein